MKWWLKVSAIGAYLSGQADLGAASQVMIIVLTGAIWEGGSIPLLKLYT